MRYYHGSFELLPVATVLAARGPAYVADWSGSDFYSVLERHRPLTSRAHHEAVFMVANPDDIDAAGGFTEWCSEVVPDSPVERHDLGWCSHISEMLSDGRTVEDDEVRCAAEAYWLGAQHPTNSLWEYLCARATVVRCEPFDTFEIESDAAPSRTGPQSPR